MITNMLSLHYLQAYIGTMKVLLYRKWHDYYIMSVCVPTFWHLVSHNIWLDGFIFAGLVLGYKIPYKYY